MADKKKCIVHIQGKEYALISDDSYEHVLASARVVDDLLSSVSQKAVNTDFDKILMLTAIRLASDLLQARSQLDDIACRHEVLYKQIAQELFS